MEKLARTGTRLDGRPYDAGLDAFRLMKRAEPEAWFAVQTRYRYEKKVAEQLLRKGVDVFLPLRKEDREWSDRHKGLLVPLFPGYAFVRSAKSVLARFVLQTPGVVGFVSLGGTAATVPQKQMADLQLLLAENVSFSFYPFVQLGRRIRIRGGCLNGVEGLLVERETGKLVISIKPIQRSLAIEIQGCDLEMI